MPTELLVVVLFAGFYPLPVTFIDSGPRYERGESAHCARRSVTVRNTVISIVYDCEPFPARYIARLLHPMIFEFFHSTIQRKYTEFPSNDSLLLVPAPTHAFNVRVPKRDNVHDCLSILRVCIPFVWKGRCFGKDGE